jgi:hypothetical protein
MTTADAPLSPGAREIVLQVTRTAEGGGAAALRVDGRTVAAGRIPRLLFTISSLGMDLGRSLSPVTDDYAAPFAYGGTLKEVIFDIPTRQPPGEARAEVRAEIARQ